MIRLWVACVVGWGLLGCVSGRDIASEDEREASRPNARADDRNQSGDPTGNEPAGDQSEDPEPGRLLTYYRDTKPIFDAKCTGCHVDGGIGPFPLTSYGEVKPNVDLIKIDVDMGIMPPWRAIGPLDIYVGDRRLSDEQRETIVTWIEQGAVEGDRDDEVPVDAPQPRGLDRIDTTLTIPEYTPQIEPDDYRCFLLDWPHQEVKYVTGLSVVPDRTENMHHAIVYLVQPENAAATRSRDDGDPGPGYTCFGGAGTSATWLTSYEPGGYGQQVPNGVGFEIRPGSLMLLQVHYNTLNGGPQPDQSWVDFTVQDSVERVGRVVLLMQPTWPAGFMAIPANEPDTMHRYQGRGSLNAQTTYDIIWVDLHMHTLGSRGGMAISRADGTIEPLLQILDWSYQWQETYMLREPVKLFPGDQMIVECHFDNTAENQAVFNGQRLEPRDVNWGDGTTDEMCLGNILATEAL